MTIQKTFLSLCATALLLTSCSKIPTEAYFERGQPESLLDQSSEIVNFDIMGVSSVDELVSWVNQDQPTRAELYCEDGDPICLQAHEALEQFGVPVLFVPSGENVATLVYERVLARDCENRYIDNSINPYNLLHPTFGCTISSNIVQMVTDKRQFTSPALLDYRDGDSVARTMEGYRTPNSYTPRNIDPNFDNVFEIETESNTQ